MDVWTNVKIFIFFYLFFLILIVYFLIGNIYWCIPIAIIVGATLVVILGYFLAEKYMLMPDTSPFDNDVSEEHDFGANLKGFLFKNPNTDRIIIYSHGNGGNLDYYIPSIKRLTQKANVFIYNYPGYGKSPGVPSEEKILSSGIQAYDYLRSLGYTKIYGYGFSMGGAATVEIARQRKLKGIVLQSVFLELADAVPIIGKLVLQNKFQIGDKLDQITCPVIVAHSKRDQIIPYSVSQKIYGSLSSRKKYFFELSADHGDLPEEDEYYEFIEEKLLC